MSPILKGVVASQITGRLATNSFESIATVTVGSGGASSISFTSIPSTYKHLQARAITRSTNAAYFSQVFFTINGATSYFRHLILNDGVSSPGAYGYVGQSYASLGYFAGNNTLTGVFGAVILDILDYSNTNKYKTYRGLGGANNNSQASPDTYQSMVSGAYQDATTPISSLVFTPETGSFAQYTTYALYGIKG
jgi:hypothetical protein